MPAYRCQFAGFVGGIFLLLSTASSAQLPAKACECEFSSRDYQAFGTGGACGFFMFKQASVCEISFSGTGANPAVLASILGPDVMQAQLDIAQDIFGRYLTFIKTGDIKPLSEHAFIERSLPVMARASLFRSAPQIAEAPIRQMDALARDLANKFSDELEAIFLGKAEPHTVKWDADSVFELGRGYVQINYKGDTQLRVVYFSPAMM